jgi:hypothetical protein
LFRQFIRLKFKYQKFQYFKLFKSQEWLTSSSWMGDGCALTSPVIPHPPFHLHHHQHPHHIYLHLGRWAAAAANGCKATFEKKNILQNPKKKKKKIYNILYWLSSYLIFCKLCFCRSMYITMYKIFGKKKNICYCILIFRLLKFK